MEGFCVATEKFYVATLLARLGRFSIVTELSKARGKCVATEPVYVATELARIGRISVATEDF